LSVPSETATHDIVVIGASAGGVEALVELVRVLPPDIPAAIFVVLHVSPQATSVLPRILSRSGLLPAVHPADGDPIERGRIYVAPPDRHLLLHEGRVHVVRGPRENGHRPAVDPLFRTAARIYGPRVAAVVLTGSGDDGTAGLMAVKQRGGVAVVQNPAEAMSPRMPRSALEHVQVDYCLPLAQIPHLLVRLAGTPCPTREEELVSEQIVQESLAVEAHEAYLNNDDRPGAPSVFSCPECHGCLWEVSDSELVRFRCRVGHAYTAHSLEVEQNHALEAALWAALRSLEESATMARRMEARAAEQGHTRTGARYREKADDTEQQARVVRELLLRGHKGHDTGASYDPMSSPADEEAQVYEDTIRTATTMG